VKLLFDENLSPRLVATLASEFPESAHIETLGMRGETDAYIWNYARDSGFVIISKDNDFRQRAFLHGPPPKIIWLSIGNAGTVMIAGLLQRNKTRILNFFEERDAGLLVLEL
jgi:predicted nuclease of predicted toxin-antitoxin system